MSAHSDPLRRALGTPGAPAERDTTASGFAGELERAVAAIAGDLVARAPGRVHHVAAAVFERALIQHVLDVTGGNQLRAARLLGMNRNTLRKRARQLAVLPGGPRPESVAAEG